MPHGSMPNDIRNSQFAASKDGAMASLLVDEHIDPRIGQRLSRLGHSIETVRSFSKNKAGDGWPDEEVVKFAIKKSWMIVTANATDFMQLAKQYPHHPGIILCSPDHPWWQVAKRIDSEIREAGGNLFGQIMNLTARPSKSSKSRAPTADSASAKKKPASGPTKGRRRS